MSATVSLESTLRRPFRAADWPDVTLVGTLLVLAAPTTLPALMLAGYLVRVVRSTGSDRLALPSFDDPVQLLRDGLAPSAVLAVYQLPTLVAGAVTLALVDHSVGFVPGVSPRGDFAPALSSAASSIGAVSSVLDPLVAGPGLYGAPVVAAAGVTALFGAVTGYLGTAAALEAVRAGTIPAGFDLDRLRRTATARAFVEAWLVGVGLLFGANVAAAVVDAVPVVGSLAGAALTFHAACAAAGVLARAV